MNDSRRRKTKKTRKKRGGEIVVEDIENECEKNDSDEKGNKLCPISYEELGKNGEYILKDGENGYCFNYSSIKNKNGNFRTNMDKNPMNRNSWTPEFIRELDWVQNDIKRKIKMKENKLMRTNGRYWIRGDDFWQGDTTMESWIDQPCCTKCEPHGCMSALGCGVDKCSTCDENFQPTGTKKKCKKVSMFFTRGGKRNKKTRKKNRNKRGRRKKKTRKKQGGEKSKKIKKLTKIFQQYPKIFPSGYFRFLAARLENHINKNTLWYRNGVVLTWIKYQKTVKKNDKCIIKPGDVKLDQIVNKNQGNGAAKKVVMQFLKKFEKNRIWLEVRSNNKRAIKFYRKNGFKKVCNIKFGEIPGIMMVKN